jgi:hypothetical protein
MASASVSLLFLPADRSGTNVLIVLASRHGLAASYVRVAADANPGGDSWRDIAVMQSP